MKKVIVECGNRFSFIVPKENIYHFGQVIDGTKTSIIKKNITPSIINLPKPKQKNEKMIKKVERKFSHKKLVRNQSMGSNSPQVERIRSRINSPKINRTGSKGFFSLASRSLKKEGSLKNMLKSAFLKNTTPDIDDDFYDPTRIEKKDTQKKRKVISISAKGDFALFLTNDGNVWLMGELLSKKKRKLKRIKKFGKDIKATRIVSGGGHAFVITEKNICYALGDSLCGQCGVGSFKFCKKPVKVKLGYLTCIKDLQCGWRHSIFLCSNGTMFSCGKAFKGCLGIEGESNKCDLTMIPMNHPIKQIWVGYNHNFCMSDSNKVFGWGNNSHFQLSLNDREECCRPVELKHLEKLHIVEVSMGFEFSMFRTKENKVFAVGKNSRAQLCLGFAGKIDFAVPTEVIIRPFVNVDEYKNVYPIKVSCGNSHSVFLLSNGDIWSGGVNLYSELGIRSKSNESFVTFPSLVENFSDEIGVDDDEEEEENPELNLKQKDVEESIVKKLVRTISWSVRKT